MNCNGCRNYFISVSSHSAYLKLSITQRKSELEGRYFLLSYNIVVSCSRIRSCIPRYRMADTSTTYSICIQHIVFLLSVDVAFSIA